MAPHLAFQDLGESASGAEFTLLHGFTQNAQCWSPFSDLLAAHSRVRLFDMPGHGGSSEVRANLVETAELVENQMNDSFLIGYSMGGRVALHLALLPTTKLRGLVLIGATAGLKEERKRMARRTQDAELAVRLQTLGLDLFLDEWLAQPLFAHLTNTHKESRLQNSVDGLISSLELCGTGTQMPLWDQLVSLSVPVLLLSGAQDKKFTDLAQEMSAAIGDNATALTIADAGHSVHLEKPQETANAIFTWQASIHSSTADE